MILKICQSLLVTAMLVAPLHTVWADGAPTKDAVTARVKGALGFYKANGRDKTIAELNKKDGQFASGEDYVDLHDTSGVCLAHPISPGIVGLNWLDQADPTG